MHVLTGSHALAKIWYQNPFFCNNFNPNSTKTNSCPIAILSSKRKFMNAVFMQFNVSIHAILNKQT